ncbi:FtsW/RodA/SpoVE family cell cycle protein [Sodaliphilus pleomorphus]|jgi:cell division protein FtsW|uniref:Probable peptidoglycan glycosyltransferase FtsW n=1 Tax=Sodaliphilus pleomorphus TaxID=2606626 RepID=A0A6L5XGH2_9BACT|nr:FtsW/RodA/SpoVE family cell cycle protein [Sodaliphilus pleomorphus]MCI6170434.1 FtsW/RodA/SpoVE family cell cycle protein [Muribaculaceae bacterium]MDD6688314.1 FtsW/RodA/SpoVE family cell cycle protein [Sodaliphilus pleomorphus]MSS18621.1 FtsW/RodA/SpoVE family cell cycle protein [Sodaliphilus pleomorphus]
MSEKAKRYEEMSRKYGDPWIWGIYFTLIFLSIIESYSASSREVATAGVYMPIIKQVVFLAIGGLLLYVIYRVDYNNKTLLAIMIPGLGLVTLLCLVYVRLFGEVVNGAQRAITLPGFTIQPAELAKLSIVTLLAYILARNQKNKDVKTTGMVEAASVVAVFGFLLLQSGLTNTLLLMCISGSMMLIGGARLKRIGYVLVAYAVLFGVFWVIKNHNDNQEATLNGPGATSELIVQEGDTLGTTGGDKPVVNRQSTWKNRILDWWHSDSLVYKPITSKNTQEMISRMAQAHGGITGVGLGNSRECSRLPLAFSDYIYSIIVEEMGLIGGVCVLILYLWLLARAAMIARRCRRVLPALLIIGMASMVAFQALFHMAINVGVFPVSGQPLPLISKGGTSIIVTSVAFAIMLSISRTIANQNSKNNKTEEAQLPDDLRAENPTQMIRENEWK